MTSSLVGSEMCIRDRGLAGNNSPQQGRGRLSHLARRAGSKLRWLEVPESVSYTHLTLPTICSV
eukprot:6170635-Prorocentrum_lima.AAC.1